ncbi:MAG: hypothetical protein ACI9FN_000397, partial [Saprospiraceae bacterium]
MVNSFSDGAPLEYSLEKINSLCLKVFDNKLASKF